MKKKRYRLLRIPVELEICRPAGWLLLPYYAAWIYLTGFRVVAVTPMLGGSPVGKIRMVTVPKLTLKRADAP